MDGEPFLRDEPRETARAAVAAGGGCAKVVMAVGVASLVGEARCEALCESLRDVFALGEALREARVERENNEPSQGK